MVAAPAPPSAGAVRIAIDAAPSSDNASSSGRTAARAVAATMIEMRSLAMSAGRPPPPPPPRRRPPPPRGGGRVSRPAHDAVEELHGAARQLDLADDEARR